MAEKLLKGEKVHLTKLRGKNKYYFDADIVLSKDGNITFEGTENIKNDTAISDKPVGKCPKCGADVLEGSYSYFCSKKDQGCTFYIKKTMGNMEITRDIAEKLLKDGKTELLTGFTSKRGKPFSAYLYIDPKTNTVKFEFENKKTKKKTTKRKTAKKK